MKPTTGERRLLAAAITLVAILFFVFTIWIVYEANIGRDNAIFKIARATPYGDKIGHFLLSGALTLFANFSLRHRGFRVRGVPLPYGSLAVLVLVIAEEASQHYLPTRTLDIKDALANVAGILVFSTPSLLRMRRIQKP